jgi:hypothetical protein
MGYYLNLAILLSFRCEIDPKGQLIFLTSVIIDTALYCHNTSQLSYLLSYPIIIPIRKMPKKIFFQFQA